MLQPTTTHVCPKSDDSCRSIPCLPYLLLRDLVDSERGSPNAGSGLVTVPSMCTSTRVLVTKPDPAFGEPRSESTVAVPYIDGKVLRSYIIENTQYINTALIRGVLSFRPTHVTQKKRLSTDFFCGR